MGNLVRALIGIAVVALVCYGVYWLVSNRSQTTTDVGNVSSSSVENSNSSSTTSSQMPSVDLSGLSSSSEIKPVISSVTPEDSFQTNQELVTVRGQTESNNKVNVAGSEVAVDSNGNFAKGVNLNIGENQILVVATNPLGKTTTQAFTYIRTADSVSSSSISLNSSVNSTSATTNSQTNLAGSSSSISNIKPLRTGGFDNTILGLLISVFILGLVSLKVFKRKAI